MLPALSWRTALVGLAIAAGTELSVGEKAWQKTVEACRGGSYPPPPDYQQSEYGGYSSSDLPPDLPPSDGDDAQYRENGAHQQPPNHQGQYRQPPPLPPGYDDPRQQMPPPPPGYDDQSLFQDQAVADEPPMMESWDDTSSQGGMDLSSFDKEYILSGLARLYRKKILPLELSSRYGHFHSPPLSPADFVAPPMVLLLGQYRYAACNFEFKSSPFLHPMKARFSVRACCLSLIGMHSLISDFSTPSFPPTVLERLHL